MKDWLKAMIVPVMVFITGAAAYLTYGAILTAGMTMYSLNFTFMASLTEEQKANCHTGDVAKMLVIQVAIPLIVTSAIWMVAFFVQRRRLRD